MTAVPEDAAYEAIAAAVEDADEDDPLFEAEVHDTVYQRITKDYGVRVGECEADISPLRGGKEMDEFDATFMLVCFVRVAGTDKSQRKAARAKVRALALRVAKVFYDDMTMGGKVRNSRLLRGARGFDSLEAGDVYAVANLPMIVNETGESRQRQ